MSDIALGLSACGVASLCFGTMYVPIRLAGDPGDGIVVQWMICSAIFLMGLLTYISTGGPPFQPFAMIGGALWALGNLTAIPIINVVGVGMGILIWGVVGCVTGWAIGRFGLFGTEANVPNSPSINYAGLILVILGGILFAFVRPKTKQNNESAVVEMPKVPPSSEEAVERSTTVEERAELMKEERGGESEGDGKVGTVMQMEVEKGEGKRQNEKKSVKEKYRKKKNALRERVIAIALAVFAGTCYGLMFTPVVYMQDNPQQFDNPPANAIYYVFSHFTGIYLTSTAVLLIYIAYKRNKPFVDNKLLFPSLMAGIFWAVAMLAWFVANDLLSQSITFPINGMAPGVIASLWSVLYFKEIEQTELKKLFVAILISLFGVILVGLSKTL